MSNLRGHIRCSYCPHPILSCFQISTPVRPWIWFFHILYPDEEKPGEADFAAPFKDISAFAFNLLALQSGNHYFASLCLVRSFPSQFPSQNNHLRSLKGTLDPWECLNAECKDPNHKSLFRRHSREDVFQLQSIQNVVLPLQVKMLSYFTKYVYNFCDYYKKSSSFTSILNASFKNLLNIKVKMINDPTVQR